MGIALSDKKTTMKSDSENVTENSAKSRNIAVKSAEGEKGPLRVLELFAGIGGMHRACQLLQELCWIRIQCSGSTLIKECESE